LFSDNECDLDLKGGAAITTFWLLKNGAITPTTFMGTKVWVKIIEGEILLDCGHDKIKRWRSLFCWL
jgi:hypothetical protein